MQGRVKVDTHFIHRRSQLELSRLHNTSRNLSADSPKTEHEGGDMVTRDMRWLAPLLLCLAVAACSAAGGLDPLPPAASVAGSICDPNTHLYVADANVTLTEYNNQNVEVRQHTAQTDLTGHFLITAVGDGTAQIVAQKDAFDYKTTIAVNGSGSITLPAPTGCALATGTITGQACDAAAGAWMQGATVTVDSSNGPIPASQPTDDLGDFVIDNVPAGDHTVTATGTDGTVEQYAVSVPPGGSIDLGITQCVAPGLSNIQGQICANVDGVWLANASVSTSSNGSSAQTTTDTNGVFVLRGLQPGTYQITVSKGPYQLQFSATTTINKTTVLTQPMCTASNLAVAAVSGEFDAVQKVFAALQFTNISIYAGWSGQNTQHDLQATQPAGSWSTQLLTSVNGAQPEIYNYKIVIFNSGLDVTDLGPEGSAERMAKQQVLNSYVNQGGFIYVSDWAYPVIADNFAAPLTFAGDGSGDGSAEIGQVQTVANASILDSGLAAALSATSLSINLLLPQVALLSSVGTGASTYIQGTVQVPGNSGPALMTNVPLLVGFSIGQGRGIFSSFDDDAEDDTQENELMNYLVLDL